MWYWRVGLTTSDGIVYSPTFMFRAVAPAGRRPRRHRRGGSFGWTQTRWGVAVTFYTRTPLPSFLPVGTYRACIKAWDKAWQ